MYELENGALQHSHQQAQYGFFQSYYFKIPHLIFKMYLC